MTGIRDDIRFALKQAGKNPGLVLIIMIIVGIGIGANTTIASLAKAPLNMAVSEPTRLVLLWSVNHGRAIDRSPIPRGDFADLKMNLRSAESLAAFADESVQVTGAAEPLRLTARRVSSSFFSVLGVKPAFGRDFALDEANQTEPVAILTFATWRTAFGADPGVLQRTIAINGVSHRIVGVMPDLGLFSYGAALWTPMKDPAPSEDRIGRELTVVARIPPSVDVAYHLLDPRPRIPKLQAELATLSKQLADAHPELERGWEIGFTWIVPLRESEVVASNLLLITPILILAIACANIANLLLARASNRKREIAVRIALGASRVRIVRLLLVESVFYGVLGAIPGIGLGVWGTDLARRFGSSPFWENAKVDFWVLSASLIVAVLSGVVFGLAPALHTLRFGVNDYLKQGAANITIDRKSHRLQSLLMTGQIAVATLLLLVMGLMLRSALQLRDIELGFQVEQVLTFSAEIPAYRYPSRDSVAAAHLRIVDDLRQVPGMQFAGAGTRVPTAGGRNNHTEQFAIEGRDEATTHVAVDLTVTPGYFETLAIPVLRGRLFHSGDIQGAQPVAIVSRAMADRYWPGQDVIGQRVRLSNLGPTAPWISIVGMVGDVRNDYAVAPPLAMLYFPMNQRPVRIATYVVRTSAGAEAAAGAVRSVIRKFDPTLPLFGVQTMSQVVYDDLYGTYFIVEVLAVFATLALLLATLGVFGVLSHVTSERRSEIAVRIAVGALPRQVVRAFIWKGLKIALVGIAVGVAGGLAVSPVIGSLLYGVSSTDAPAFGFAIAVLLFATLAACYLPAHRAAKVDPMSVLRCE